MKRVLCAFLLILFVNQLFSQGFKYGVAAGLNYTTNHVNYTEYIDSKYKVGYQFNAILEYRFGNRIGLRIEPGFANRGYMSKYDDTYYVNLNYLSSPILICYYPFDKFSIQLGPELSYRLSAKVVSDDHTSDVKDLYDSKYDFGINFGLSYQLFNKVNIGVRYNRGFVSTVKDLTYTNEYGLDARDMKLYNQGFSFLVTYMIK